MTEGKCGKADSPARCGERAASAGARIGPRLSKAKARFVRQAFTGRFWRELLPLLAMAAGCCLVWSGFNIRAQRDDLRGWLQDVGDEGLLRLYDGAKDVKERHALGIVFKTYEHRYGKGVWARHFNQENAGEGISYRDIAEVAVGIDTAEERGEFVSAHAAVYEACIRSDNIGFALRYGSILKELRGKGGESWKVAASNPFAVCVYEAVKQDADLWGWYLDNAAWCDAFLVTLEPNLQEGGTREGAGLVETVASLRDYAPLFRKFSEEIGALSGDDLKTLADGENVEECRDSLFASCLTFGGIYHNVLSPMLNASAKIPMLEAMAVVANNRTAFGLGAEDALDSTNACRNAAMGFVRIHDERGGIWDFAAGERGIDCLAFCERVGNDAWCEQVIGMFGEAEVVPFLNKYYGDTSELLRVATETLYRCQEPGWAVLNEYKNNAEVKRLLLKPRIGYRLVPYYLRKGYAAFSELDGDERWIDELLDKNGNLKKQDVSWYEMSPIGGDVLTVVKKWAQNRPVTAGELGWAALDIADTAATALSFGMSKVATTGGKTAVKVALKCAGRRVARDIAKKTMRSIAKETAVRSVTRSTKPVVKKRVISFWAKVHKWFKKTPGVSFKAKEPEVLSRAWHRTRGLDQETWRQAYKGCKALTWCRCPGHTLPDKDPDFVHTVLESSGEFVGKTLDALVNGAGAGFKAAVQEVLGTSGGGMGGKLRWILGGGLFVLGLFKFLKAGSQRRDARVA